MMNNSQYLYQKLHQVTKANKRTHFFTLSPILHIFNLLYLLKTERFKIERYGIFIFIF